MKNLLKIVHIFSLYMLCTPIFSMQLTWQVTKKYGIECTKKIISKSFTAAHWGISAGPFIIKGLAQIGLSIFDKEICDQLLKHSDVDVYIQQFADEQAKTVGLQKMPSIRTMHLKAIFGAANNVVIIDYEYASQLKIALETNNKEKINEAKGILQHEHTHIKNKDLLTSGTESLITPFLTHQLTKTASQSIPFAQKLAPFWLQQSLKISSSVGKFALNSAILNASSRHKEQRADEGICNDIPTLQGAINGLANPNEQTDLPKNYLKQKFIKLNYYLFASHPTIDVRITRLNKRIEIVKNDTHF